MKGSAILRCCSLPLTDPKIMRIIELSSGDHLPPRNGLSASDCPFGSSGPKTRRVCCIEDSGSLPLAMSYTQPCMRRLPLLRLLATDGCDRRLCNCASTFSSVSALSRSSIGHTRGILHDALGKHVPSVLHSTAKSEQVAGLSAVPRRAEHASRSSRNDRRG